MADGDTPNKDGKPPEDAVDAGTESLPPVESLDKDSDFTPFLADGVPEDLARAALRKLWRSDSSLAGLDGLDDYDEDYSIIKEVASAVAEALTGNEEEAESAASVEETPPEEAPDKEEEESEGEEESGENGGEEAETASS